MIDKTSLDVEPIEQHDVVGHTENLVLELIHVGIIEIDSILMLLVDNIHHTGVADTVTVSKYNLGISVTLRVIGHS